MKTTDILEYKIKREEMKQLVSTDYSIEPIKDDILRNYSDLLESEPRIFRGAHYNVGCSYHINPAAVPRLSQNTTNEAIFLVSTLTNWITYPKRSRSLICSSSNDGYTRSFGNDTYVVLPKNGSRIGICQAQDFWTSFQYMKTRASIRSIDDFNIYLNQLLKSINSGYDDKSYGSVMQTLKEADKKITSIAKNTTLDDIRTLPEDIRKLIGLRTVRAYYGDNLTYQYIEGKMSISNIKYPNETFIEFISDILDPVKNGFKLSNTNDLIDDLGRNHDLYPKELWTDGPCYLIPQKVYDQLFALKDSQWLR